jgi:small subunit ribosomal protein S19
MSRSIWKPIYNENISELLKKNLNLKFYNRSINITKDLINQTIKIYNGIRFFEVYVTDKMVGHKLGEYSPTRKIPLHKKKKIKYGS